MAAQPSREQAHPKVNGWITGFSVFAAIMLVAIGTMHFLMGLSAVLDDTFYVVNNGYAYKFDVTTWGWIHLVGGIVIAVAGFGVLTRNIFARIVGIVVATGSIIWSFQSIPYYPLWSILIIALDICVIWALAAHGGEPYTDEAL